MKTLEPTPKRLKAIVSLTVLFGIACIASKALALPQPSLVKENGASDVNSIPPENIFEYLIENRSDPFAPFISEKSTSANINEIIPVSEQLSGMQLFEPGQLTLVAIIMAENNEFAMAEDTTGKGYVLHTGMKIGKRGIITAIQTNEVLIEETAFTRAGKKLTSQIVMLLKKEGDE